MPPSHATASYRISPEMLIERSIYGFASRDIRSRPFNLLRSQLLKLMRSRKWKVLGITSATPGAGKSFIATNLAASLSRTAGLDVYLVDLDLRRPSVARVFGIDNDLGVIDYLEEVITDLGVIAQRINDERLIILPGVPRPVSSAELLASPLADKLFEAFRALPQDAIAIFDLPPVFANDDAMIVSRAVDANLLVVEDGITTKKQIRDCFQLLAPTPFAGTILNRYRGGLMRDDYGYGYGFDRSYGGYYD